MLLCPWSIQYSSPLELPCMYVCTHMPLLVSVHGVWFSEFRFHVIQPPNKTETWADKFLASWTRYSLHNGLPGLTLAKKKLLPWPVVFRAYSCSDHALCCATPMPLPLHASNRYRPQSATAFLCPRKPTSRWPCYTNIIKIDWSQTYIWMNRLKTCGKAEIAPIMGIVQWRTENGIPWTRHCKVNHGLWHFRLTDATMYIADGPYFFLFFCNSIMLKVIIQGQ